MIDSLVRALKIPWESSLRSLLGLDDKPYAVLTLHRPSNVDNADQLRCTLEAIAEVAQRIAVVFPAHPRTARNIEAAGLSSARVWNGGPLPGPGLWMMPPLPTWIFLTSSGMLSWSLRILVECRKSDFPRGAVPHLSRQHGTASHRLHGH